MSIPVSSQHSIVSNPGSVPESMPAPMSEPVLENSQEKIDSAPLGKVFLKKTVVTDLSMSKILTQILRMRKGTTKYCV